MTDIDSYLDELSSGSPVPGGGSVAALETAIAASLLVMVTNLTLGRKRYAAAEEQVRLIQARAIALRDRARALEREDTAAYRLVSEVMAQPRDTEEERAERSRRLQDALKGAAGPPLETMRCAASVLELSAELVEIGNRSAVSDVGSAALSASAAQEAARLNVEINMAAVRDDHWKQHMQAELVGIVDSTVVARRVLERATALIRGDDA